VLGVHCEELAKLDEASNLGVEGGIMTRLLEGANGLLNFCATLVSMNREEVTLRCLDCDGK
jgi:hypothetical protein